MKRIRRTVTDALTISHRALVPIADASTNAAAKRGSIEREVDL
jgi:hypothetical protein